MARTTLTLDDDLLKKIQEKAAREGRTSQDVVNELLRQALPTRNSTNYKLVLRGWKAIQRPTIDLSERDELFDQMDGRRHR